MIIDAHSHLRVPLPGLGDATVNIYGVRNSGVEDYLRDYRANGVDACFVFPLEGFRMESVIRAENEALAAAAREHPDRLIPFATVCPHWPEKRLRDEIGYALGELKLRGLKFVNLCQGVALSNPGMDIVAEEALAWHVPVALHDGSPEYCSAIQVVGFARRYPDLRVLSAHGGLREYWPDLIDGARELPHLYICLSGPTQWGLQALYDALGPEKLLFGSDGGIGHPAVTTAYLRRIARLRAPAAHKAMILGENARRFIASS